MSVRYVREKYAGRNASSGDDASRSYTKVVIVQTDSPHDGAIVVCNHPLVPQFGTYYATANEADSGAMLRRRRPKQTGPKTWEVSCEFSTRARDPDDQEENPLARPPKHSWSGVEYDTFPSKDLDDVPFMNSAFWRYDPAIAVPETYGVLVIVRNEPIFDMDRAEEFSNVVNENRIFGRDPGKVLLKPPRGDQRFENNINFVAVTYELWINKKGWITWALDAGPFAIKRNAAGNPTGEKLHADEAGIKHTEDIPLDGNGNVLPMAERIAGRFRERGFRVYETKNFGVLELE